MIARAVAFKVSRRKMKERPGEHLASELLWPIVQGLGRAIDATLFTALENSSTTAWALGKAAEQGVPFEALKAIVGSAGTGTQVIEGRLFADGIPAQLSPDLLGTWAGMWSRAAIVVDPDISVTVTRLNKNGALEVVCWAHMQALVPDPEMFWAMS